MKKQINDGWHTIAGHQVYVEGGRVLRGLKLDHNNSQVTAYPYRANRYGSGWDNDVGITVEAFRAGIKRGTIIMT